MNLSEKKLLLEGWYSAMIAMGMVPENENLYFEAKDIFLSKYEITSDDKINIEADSLLEDIKNKYYELSKAKYI